MTTAKQDKEFLDSVISRSLLEDAIDWISKNLNPEDVFSEKVLEDWAIDWAIVNGWRKEE